MSKTATAWGILLHLMSCQLTPTSHRWSGYWRERIPNKKYDRLFSPFLVSISIMFDMGYTQYMLIHLVKQEAAQEVGYALLFICSSMLLTDSLPLLWVSSFSTALACATHRPECLRVSLSQCESPTAATVFQDCLCHSMGRPWPQSLSSLSALTWALQRLKALRSSCPDTSHTEPESLRSVPTLAWVKSVQDSISSRAPSCLLISIFSAMSLQEACLALSMSPTEHCQPLGSAALP